MSASHSAHHSKRLSWLMVLIITAGTVVGTLGVCMASWTVSIIGCAIVVLGGIAALVTGIMEDVDDEPSRDLWPIGARSETRRGEISA